MSYWGVPWLQRHTPNINWTSYTVSVSSQGEQYHLPLVSNTGDTISRSDLSITIEAGSAAWWSTVLSISEESAEHVDDTKVTNSNDASIIVNESKTSFPTIYLVSCRPEGYRPSHWVGAGPATTEQPYLSYKPTWVGTKLKRQLAELMDKGPLQESTSPMELPSYSLKRKMVPCGCVSIIVHSTRLLSKISTHFPLDDHYRHLRLVLQVLRDKKLYAKLASVSSSPMKLNS